MESLERKNASTGPDEPIKSEAIMQSPDTSERSTNAASPPPNCSICLGKLINKSFTDSCLHQFCFTCLLQWSKIKTECPLCKQTFKSIIHNVRSEEDYDQYHVQYTSQVAATLDVTADIHISGQWDVAVGVGPVRPFMYRTTMGANRRYGVLLNPEAVARREQIPSITPQISNEERRRRNTNPIDYRRTVYRHGIWASALPDAFGGYRESSAAYYRRHPSEVNRLIPWLNRELQVLISNRPHIAYVMSIITEAVNQCDIHSSQFRDIVRPFFGIHTDHFVHELSNYARTNFDLVGYDQAVNYIPNRGLSNEFVPRAISPTPSRSSSSSSDSDVRILNDSLDFSGLNSFNMPSIGPHVIDMPGPSTVGQSFRIQLPYTSNVLTISSTSSSSENECEVIGYVKPRHERTPEIIDLSSSEAEEVNSTSISTATNNIQVDAAVPFKEENLPGTSSYDNGNRRTRRQTEDIAKVQMYEYLDTTSESDSDENDSDYNPLSRRRRYKSSSKKASKVVRKLRSRKHKKSTTSRRKRTKETRSRSSYSSFGSDNESSQRETSNPRGSKRYLLKSSEESDFTRKSKRSKKSKSLKKAKKRSSSNSWSSKVVCCTNYSSSYSSSSSENSESEENNKRSKCSSKRATRKTSQRKSSKAFMDSEGSSYRRSIFIRHSSSESLQSNKNMERLQDTEGNSRHCTSDEEDGNSSAFSGDTSPSYSKRKTSVKSTTSQGTNYSVDRFSTTMSTSSTKSDASSLIEHSALSKANRDIDRYRSHKKPKKRRRSRS